jgi:hypothetical protein
MTVITVYDPANSAGRGTGSILETACQMLSTGPLTQGTIERHAFFQSDLSDGIEIFSDGTSSPILSPFLDLLYRTLLAITEKNRTIAIGRGMVSMYRRR